MLVDHTWREDPVEDILFARGVTRGIFSGTNSGGALACPVFVQALKKKVRDWLENRVRTYTIS